VNIPDSLESAFRKAVNDEMRRREVVSFDTIADKTEKLMAVRDDPGVSSSEFSTAFNREKMRLRILVLIELLEEHKYGYIMPIDNNRELTLKERLEKLKK
jgi:hypothetical protein